jgi:hypothetical protein
MAKTLHVSPFNANNSVPHLYLLEHPCGRRGKWGSGAQNNRGTTGLVHIRQSAMKVYEEVQQEHTTRWHLWYWIRLSASSKY